MSVSLQIANTKYQLPGSTCTYIDLVDDEDVKLMFDEWAAWLQEEGKATRTAKLHVFIDWQSSTGKRSHGGSGQVAGLDTISETASADTPVARAPPPPGAEEHTSAGESHAGQLGLHGGD